ncbi:MAG: hypothetical protein ABMB14_30270 [Myxococcota bacterium]
MWWWILAACPKREPDVADRVADLLRAADAAWDQRGSVGLDRAADPLLDAYNLSPTDPGVGWRLARWRFTEGLVAEDPAIARGAFAEARASGGACLDAAPGFANRRTAEGWTVALSELSPDRAVCAAWTALAWVRWTELVGPEAAALDLDAIDALVVAGGTSPEPGARGIADWARGISLAIRPAWSGRDPDGARAALEQAAKADPDAAVRKLDLLRLVVGPSGDADAAARLRAQIDDAGSAPEDVRAKQLAAALSGPSPVPGLAPGAGDAGPGPERPGSGTAERSTPDPRP